MSKDAANPRQDGGGHGQVRKKSPQIGLQLRILEPGTSVTFTKTIPDIPNPRAAQDFSVLLSSYMARHRPGAKWKRESFTAITYGGRAICGVVVTLVSVDERVEIEDREHEASGVASADDENQENSECGPTP